MDFCIWERFDRLSDGPVFLLQNDNFIVLLEKNTMEIYTGDFIEISKSYASKINKKDIDIFTIEDECCNMQRDIRNKIYERLSGKFKILVSNHKLCKDIEDDLFKIINEL